MQLLSTSSYKARLRIKSVIESDALRAFHLTVQSELNDEVFTQDYIVHITMNALEHVVDLVNNFPWLFW